MCSNAAARLAHLGEAIDQFAGEAAEAGDSVPAQAAGRLAALWAMMAELDPGLARRLPGYISDGPGEDAPGPA
jgi:hypothetical protein